MAQTTPGTISPPTSTVIRAEVTAAEGAAVTDAAYPVASSTRSAGWKSVLLFPRFVGGGTPTVSIQLLWRVAVVGGNGWAIGDTTEALAEGESVTVETHGRDFFARVYALTGSPTNVSIHCAGREPTRPDGPRGS